MRKYLLSLTIPLLFVPVLAACGDDSESPRTAEPDAGEGGHDMEEASPVAPGAREIPVTGTSFAFEPDEIDARVGEDLAIVLTSEDILHDFTIDELNAHVSAEEGETAEGGVRADEPGEYTFYCSVPGHREDGMEGTLVVEA